MNKAFYVANNGVNGSELVSSNGTAATFWDLNTGGAGSFPNSFTFTPENLFFVATTAAVGTEVFVTDGNGVPGALDVDPGSASSLPSNLTRFGDKVAYVAGTAAGGSELVIGDSTGFKVFDVNSGGSGSFPANLTVAGSKLFFTATTEGSGTEVFVTDGVTAPVVLDVRPGGASGVTPPFTTGPAVQLTAFGDKVAYVATTAAGGTELVVTDGTSIKVFDANNGPASSFPGNLLAIGDNLFFTATTAEGGTEVFVTNGIDALVALDVRPGNAGSNPTLLTRFGDKIAYVADNGSTGNELVVADLNGFRSFDVNIGSASSSPVQLTAANGKLFFVANSGSTGTEVFVTDGINAPVPLDVVPGPFSGTGPSTPLTVFGDKVAWLADSGFGIELAVSDGNGFKTFDINVGAGSSAPANFTAAGKYLYFTAFSPTTGTEVYVTDGVNAPVSLDVRPGSFSGVTSILTSLTAFGEKIAYAATNSTGGTELVVGDPTGFKFFDINPGAGNSDPYALQVVDGKLFLIASTAGTGTEVFVTDGVAAPVSLDIFPGSSGSSPYLLAGAPSYAVSVRAIQPSVAEAGGTATFVLERTGNLIADTIQYNIAGQGAAPADASDFGTPLSGNIIFNAGEASRTISIKVNNDGLVEGTESFSLALSGGIAGAGKFLAATTASIIDGGLSPTSYSVSAPAPVVFEGAGGLGFVVNRGGNLGAETVQYFLAGQGAHPADAADFAGATSGTLFFAAGETSRTVTVGLSNDGQVERTEGFSLVLAGPNGLLAAGSGTILNDDRPAAGPGQVAMLGSFDEYKLYTTNAGVSVVLDTVGQRGESYAGPLDAVVFADGLAVMEQTGAGADVYRLYRAAFARNPDAEGQAFWTDALLTRGSSLGDVANGFTQSAEFQTLYGGLSNADVVRGYYRNVLGREGEDSGVSFWTAQLDQGRSKGDVLFGFSESWENIAKTVAKAGDADYGDTYRLYEAAFNRTPDAEGLQYWTMRMKAGESLPDIAREFMRSAEFKALYDGASTLEVVNRLYANVLDRPGEPAGVQFWVDKLETGTPLANVLLGFSNSDENMANTAAVTHDSWIFLG